MGSGVIRPVVLLMLASLSIAGCSTGSTGVTGTPKTTVTAPPPTVPPTTTTTTEQPGWTPVSTVNGAIAVDTQAVTGADGHVVTVFRFRSGQSRFALHVGSTDPQVAATNVGPDSGATIGPGEAPVLLAAFNGGFESSAGAGGIELNGQVLLPLQTGIASLVIDADGSAHVGVWGQGIPMAGEQVASVRQNLPPLVAGGQASPEIASIGAWGPTLGGGSVVARSSLGDDGTGNLLYAASMDALPSDLADALIGDGAVTGMELDINPEWVQLAAAPVPGAPLVAGIPGQNRPAGQYQAGWTRDFVTVLAGH